jgi:hypothetical protein
MSFSIPGSRALMVGGIFLLVGLSGLGVSVFQFYNDRRFLQEAQSTEGVVVAKEIRTSEQSVGTGVDRDTSRTTHYEATYRFSIEGKIFEGRDEGTQERWESLAEGTPVEVLYLLRDPASSRLAGPRPWFVKTIFGFVGLAFATLGAVLVARGARYAKLESRLREHGVKATSTVTELRGLALRVNDTQQWRLHYEYQDFQGHRHGNTIDMPEDEAQQWKVGDTGDVRYDSLKPTEAVWLGREEAK